VINAPKSHAIREQSPNGEIHFILPECMSDETTKTGGDFDETEMRRIMKREASKPLLLLRAE